MEQTEQHKSEAVIKGEASLTYTLHSTEHQPSIFEKMVEPMNRYQDAQIRLQMLERENPLPQDFSLRQTRYKAEMLAAELEMKELMGINKDK